MKSEIFYVLRFTSYVFRNGERVCDCKDELLDLDTFGVMLSKIHFSFITNHQLPYSLVYYELDYDSTDDCLYHRVVLDFNEWYSMVIRSYQIELDKQRIEDECN